MSTNSNSKISAGLAARNKDSKLKPAIKVSDLNAMATNAQSAVDKIKAAHDQGRSILDKWLAEIDAAEDEATILDRKPNGIVTRLPDADRAVLRKSFDTQRANATKKALAETRKLFEERRNELTEWLESAKSSALDDPVRWASQYGLGDGAVDNLIRRFQLMGPAALRQAASDILATGNKNQCAALLAVIGSMEADKRPFASAQLAAAVFAEDVEKCAGYIGIINAAVADLEIVRRELDPLSTTGSVGHAKIEKGVSDRRQADVG